MEATAQTGQSEGSVIGNIELSPPPPLFSQTDLTLRLIPDFKDIQYHTVQYHRS